MRANGFVTGGLIFRHGLHGLFDVAAAGVSINQDAVSRSTAEQLIRRRIQALRLDIPQRDVDRRDRRHGYRSASPVSALIKVLPGVLDAAGVPADQQGHDVVGQIRRDREFASVQSGITQPVNSIFGDDLERDEIASRAANNHLCVYNFHRCESSLWPIVRSVKDDSLKRTKSSLLDDGNRKVASRLSESSRARVPQPHHR